MMFSERHSRQFLTARGLSSPCGPRRRRRREVPWPRTWRSSSWAGWRRSERGVC